MTLNADAYNTSPNFYNASGNPDLAPTAQNPTIIPTFDPYLADPVQGFTPPAVFLQMYPRVNAVGSVTLGGSVTAGDTVAIDIVNGLLPNGMVQVSTIAVSGDSLATLAARLAAAINVNPFLMPFPCVADVAGDVITLYWEGPTGNATTLTGWSFSFSNTLTVTGTAHAGDTLLASFASPNFPTSSAILALTGTATTGDTITLTFSNPYLPDGTEVVTYTVATATLTAIATGVAAAINADTILPLIGMAASANNGVVSMYWNPAFGGTNPENPENATNITVSTFRAATETITLTAQNQIPPQALVPSPAPAELIVLGGAVTTGDTIQLKIFWPNLVMPYLFQYVVQSGDTTLTILGQSVASAINSNAFLQTAGFVATAGSGATAGQILIYWNLGIGFNVGFTGSVFATSGTIPALTISPSTVSATYVVSGGDSTTVMAAGIKAAINANVILSNSGLTATNSSNAMKAAIPGSLNPITYGSSVTGSTDEVLTWGSATTATITITGTSTAGNTLYLVATSAAFPGGSAFVQYVVQSGDTTANMATGLGNAVNNSGVFAGQGITATIASNKVTLVVAGTNEFPTFTTWPQQAAEIFTLTGTVTTGDVLNIVFTLPTSTHTLQYTVKSTDTTLAKLATSLMGAINADSVLIAIGLVATNPSSGVVSVSWPAGYGPITFAVSENGVETATITSTPAPQATDTVSIVVHDAGLASNPETVTYVVQLADTNALIASGLESLINADALLTAIGVTATSATNVLSIASTSKHATTYTQVVGGTIPTETVTLAGGPTETNTATGTPTETLTLADSAGSETFTEVQPTGGAGPIIPQANFVLDEAYAGATNFWNGRPVNVDYSTLTGIIAAGLPII